MERRKTPRKDWVVGKDDIGHSVLEWKVDYRATKRQESDPSARTFDFLKRLDVPDLELVEETGRKSKSASSGRDPYDSGVFPFKHNRR